MANDVAASAGRGHEDQDEGGRTRSRVVAGVLIYGMASEMRFCSCRNPAEFPSLSTSNPTPQRMMTFRRIIAVTLVAQTGLVAACGSNGTKSANANGSKAGTPSDSAAGALAASG